VAVTPSTFGGWAAIGAEFSGGAYHVVWRNVAFGQYVIWRADASGNFLSMGNVLTGTSAELRSLEPGFAQDLTGTGGIEASSFATDSAGSTRVMTAAGAYVLTSTTSSLGPQLRYGGSVVTASQFGNWAVVGAEQNGGVYQVLWRNGVLSQWVVWTVDGNGNFLSQGSLLNATQVKVYEPGFNQDFNGGGVASRTVIESAGSTTLATVSNTYYVLSSTGSSLGPSIRMNGSMVTVSQFGNWAPLAAELTGSVYSVAWKNGAADQYIAWNLDSNGNLVSMGTVVGGSSWYLQTYEPVVGRDLNGDGTTGAVTTSIETGGNTTLTRVADSYFFNYGTGGSVQLRYGGGYAAASHFGGWTPVAVEFSGGLYRMAWKNGTADQYVAWYVDTGGNYNWQSSVVAGSTWYLQSYEPVVGRDLNGDGTLGPVLTTLDVSGYGTLTRAADSYFINYGSSNIQVMYGGAYAGSNQFAPWAALGAEQIAGGFMVAWRNASTSQYTVWALDNGGNYLWNSTAISSGSSLFFAVEAAFQQDFNGGGVVGRSNIEATGGTYLANANGYLLLDSSSTAVSGPLLSVNGNFVAASQYGTALGAEWMGSGYLVAWKNGTNSYNIWTTDVTGRYVRDTGNMSGSSAQMQAYEPSFGQDLNGDGVIGVNNTPFDIQVVFSGLSQYQSYFEQAAQRWERIIRADLSSVNSATYGFIDDLRIDASVQFIDGSGGTLAQAGWDLRRSGGLPYHGVMRFDSSDITTMVNNGTFLSVVIHEMGHVLGIGTLWDTFGLRSGSSYVGTYANQAYRQLGGSGFVPLETGGGSGTAFSHWSEARFDRELMTGYVESSGSMPLSIVTVGGLQDLGYEVDYAQADGYNLPIANLESASSSAALSEAADAGVSSGAAWCGCGCVGGSLTGSSPFSLASFDLTTAADEAGVRNPDFYSAGCLAPEAEAGNILASEEGISNPDLSATGCLAPESEGGNVSLLASYVAGSFVTPLGEGASGDAAALGSVQDVIARPVV
jgi:hypothetical protein